MAANAGFRTFVSGDVLTADQVNDYLMTQAVMTFASSTARDAAITSPSEGMHAFLKDTDDLTYYDGSAWVASPVGDITGVTAGTNLSGGGSSGAVTLNLAIDSEVAFADNLATRPEIKDYAETVNAIGSTGGGTQDIDLTLGNVVTATVDTSANTFTFSNPPATGKGGSFTLILTNGGSQTVNWPAAVDWAGGTAPTLTSSGVDVLTFVTTDAGTTWLGFAAGLDMK